MQVNKKEQRTISFAYFIVNVLQSGNITPEEVTDEFLKKAWNEEKELYLQFCQFNDFKAELINT